VKPQLHTIAPIRHSLAPGSVTPGQLKSSDSEEPA
jgi:hypothetical protein